MREAVLVAANLFEEPFGGHAIEFREVAIEHDLGTANGVDGWKFQSSGHRGRSFPDSLPPPTATNQ